MALPATFWQKFGTLAQMAQATVALLGFVAILFQVNEIRSNNRAVSRATGVSRLTRIWRSRTRSFPTPDYAAIKAGSRDQLWSNTKASYRISSMPARKRSAPFPTSASGLPPAITT